MRGNTARFWGQTFPSIRTKCCRVFWLNFSLEANLWTKNQTRCRQNGCPFLLRLFEKEETLSIFWAEKSGRKCCLFSELNFFSRIWGHAARFLLSFFTKRRGAIALESLVRSWGKHYWTDFSRMKKTVHFSGWTSSKQKGMLSIASHTKRRNASTFRSFLLSKRRSVCHFCSWAPSQEQEETPSTLWPRFFLFVWWRRDSCFFCRFFGWTRFMPLPKKQEETLFHFLPDVLAHSTEKQIEQSPLRLGNLMFFSCIKLCADCI